MTPFIAPFRARPRLFVSMAVGLAATVLLPESGLTFPDTEPVPRGSIIDADRPAASGPNDRDRGHMTS